MQTYLELAEFCTLVHLSEDVVKGMIANGALNFKEEGGKIYIEANQGTFSVVPSSSAEAVPISSIQLAGESFVEKTIGTILNLHEKVLDAKDETLDTLKNENKFLKDALYSMQEIYDEDRKTIDILNAQLARAAEEIEFLKRKYKLMWNKAVENFTQKGAVNSPLETLEHAENSALSGAIKSSANSAQSAVNSAVNSQNASENLSVNSMPNSAQSAVHCHSERSDSGAKNPKASLENSAVPLDSSASAKPQNDTNLANSATNSPQNSTTTQNATANSTQNSSVNSPQNAANPNNEAQK